MLLRRWVHEMATSVTVSFGVAAHGCEAVADCEDLIRRADQALYEAKGAGRNRACVAG